MSLEKLLASAKVLPVLTIEDVEVAVPLARALLAGGLPVLEITLRTPAALAAVTAIREQLPETTVGVGTVTRGSDLEQSRRAGAQFAVSPGLSPDLVEAAKSIDLPLLPGVQTASEALSARDHGWTLLKLFPAKAAGGPALLRSLSGPLSELMFCPTGGIDAESMSSYLELPNVLCVGGSWMAPRDRIAAGDWSAITDLAAEATR